MTASHFRTNWFSCIWMYHVLKSSKSNSTAQWSTFEHKLTLCKSLTVFTIQDHVNVTTLNIRNDAFSKLDVLGNYSDYNWSPKVSFLPFSPSGMSHFTYQKPPRKAAVMVDWETMMWGFLAHPMPCTLAILRSSTLIILHPITALKGMATLILNPVSDICLVLQDKWPYCVWTIAAIMTLAI